ncbi:glycosyltransferase family 9 protein [Mesorhizobium sp. M0145]|uniref:glycosyltransferase family 9 protein n=1 Tax=Mesorhizobium sp. M0145 TaxID=2956895 RepID=UPI003338C5E2
MALLDRHHLRRNAFIAVHAGASFRGRQWQPERFALAIDEISRQTGLDFLLVGGPDERASAERIIAKAASPVVNVVGALSLATLLAVLGQARLFLGNESGPMHMAAARGNAGCRPVRPDRPGRLEACRRGQCYAAALHALRVHSQGPVPPIRSEQGLLRLAT